jgi:outer membrane lipoprotein-sorting protein
MKLPEEIRHLLRESRASASSEKNNKMLKAALSAYERTQNKRTAQYKPNRPIIWSLIMKSLSAKIAIAAVIIVAVVLGLFEFIGGGGDGSGVVWAEVARKVQASGSLVVRIRESGSVSLVESDYTIKYFSPLGSRTDVYRDGQVVWSLCTDAETKTTTVVNHDVKRYYSYQRDEGIEEFLEKDEDWTNPIYLVQAILSVEHTELGEKTVDGILCEGLETSDPAVMGDLVDMADSLDVHMTLWVDVQTQYPVRFESRAVAEAEGEVHDSDCVIDQFQWDAEIDPSRFELEIPDDYYKSF